MKVGLLIYGDLNTLSGGYLYDRMLVRELTKAGATVEIISIPWRNYAWHLTDNFRPSILSDIQATGIDILLQDELNHPSLIAVNRQIRAQRSLPIIAIVHHLRADESHPEPLLWFYRRIETAYLQSVDGYIVNSWTTRRAVESLVSLPATASAPLSSKPMLVAHPAGDHLGAPPAAEVLFNIETDLATSAQNGASELKIVSVGNLIARKSVHIVIAALALLRKRDPAIRFSYEIVGSLDADLLYVTRLHEQATVAGLSAAITFHGRVADEHLSRLLSAGNLFVLPSFEGFGIAYLEAMAHGLCPIASTQSAAQELVHHGYNGFLVPPDSPHALAALLAELAQNPERLHQTRRQALHTAMNHPTWQTTFAPAYNWLHEVLHQKSTHQ